MQSIHNIWQRASRTGLVQLAIASWNSFQRTNCVQMSAGIALFAMLSLLPLSMLVISSLPVLIHSVFPHYDVRGSILHFAQLTISPVGRRWLQEVLQSLSTNGIVVDSLSLLAFAWAASQVFSQIDSSFYRIWRESERLDQAMDLRQAVVAQIRQRRNAIGLLALAFVSFVGTLMADNGLAALINLLPRGTGKEIAAQIASPVLSWMLGIFFFFLLFQWFVYGRIPGRAAFWGAVVTSFANQLVRLLVTNFVDSTIGASNTNIGGPLALMLGVYLFMQNILIGYVIACQIARPLPNAIRSSH